MRPAGPQHGYEQPAIVSLASHQGDRASQSGALLHAPDAPTHTRPQGRLVGAPQAPTRKLGGNRPTRHSITILGEGPGRPLATITMPASAYQAEIARLQVDQGGEVTQGWLARMEGMP